MLFVDEEAMAELNKRFLGKDGPTDVLAFPIDDDDVVEGGRSPDSRGPGPSADPRSTICPLLGDVVICPAVAARNAPDHAGTYDDEMALLVVHGILHLLGMDHVDDDGGRGDGAAGAGAARALPQDAMTHAPRR